VEYIAGHAYRPEFRDRGAHTGLGFLLKWVDHDLNENEPSYDIHAVLRMDPSYLTSFALWGSNGKTAFAKIIIKSGSSERKRLLNKCFHAVYEEHVSTFANPREGRTLDMELINFSNAIPPVNAEPAFITDIPWPEAPYSPPGILCTHTLPPSPATGTTADHSTATHALPALPAATITAHVPPVTTTTDPAPIHLSVSALMLSVPSPSEVPALQPPAPPSVAPASPTPSMKMVFTAKPLSSPTSSAAQPTVCTTRPITFTSTRR
jgi:hypothetical protein